MEQLIIPKKPLQKEQRVPFDPSRGTPGGQAVGILGEPAPVVEQTQPPWWQRGISMITAPIRWWSKSVTQPLAEIGTQWFRDVMDGDTENPDWQNVKTAWNSGMQEGGLFKALEKVGATRAERPDYFWGERFFGEVLADPANLIGWGLFGTAAKAGVRAAATGGIKLGAIGSRLPILGEPLGRAEALYLAAALAPFRGFGKLMELTPLSNIQKGMHIQADVMYAGRKALGTKWQTNEGTIAHWYNSWRNEALAGNPLTEDNAKLVGYLRRAESIAEDMPLEETLVDGGLLDTFFTNQSKMSPQEFTTYLGDMLRVQEVKRAKEFTEARIAGALPEGTVGGQLGQKWARMDVLRKELVSAMEGSNAYKGAKWYRTFERWFLRAPAVAILSYSMYAPMNALEEVFRTLVSKMQPGWEKNPQLATIIHSLAPPGMMEGVIATDIANLKNQIDFVPGVIGKLTIGASNALANMRRATALNAFMSRANKAMVESADYQPVVELLQALKGLKLDKSTESTMRQLIVANAYNNGSDFIGLADKVLSDKFFTASKIQEKVDRMYMQDLSPVAKQQILDGAQKAVAGDDFAGVWADTMKVARETITDDFARRPEVFSAAIANHLKHIKNTPARTQADALYQIETLRDMQEELKKVLDAGNAARYDRIVKAMEREGVDFSRVHREHNTWRKQSNKLSEQANKMFTDAIADLRRKIKPLPGQAPLAEAAAPAARPTTSTATSSRLLAAFENKYKSYYDQWTQGRDILEEHLVNNPDDWLSYYRLEREHISKGIARGEADEVYEKAHEEFVRAVGGETVSADLSALRNLKPLMDQAREFAPTHADGFTMASANLDDLAAAVLADLPGIQDRWAAQSGLLAPYMKTLAKQLDDIPSVARAAYKDSVVSVWDTVKTDIAGAVTDYSGQKLIDETMTGAIPFWTYSTRALEWILRMGAQRPALGINFYPYGRYWEETDSGYLPTPLLGLQASPSRTMGILSKLRRWQTPDYPPQHQGLAGFAEESQEALARAGLFPAPIAGGAVSLLTSVGDIAQGKPTIFQFAESLPPWFTSALDLLYFGATVQIPNAAPLPEPVVNAINDVRNAGAVQEFVDGAHTFLARSPYSEMFVRRYAWDIYGKAWSDLEPEQQRAAKSGGALINAVSTQLGFVRYKPQSLIDARQEVTEMMAKEVGVTVKEIEEAAKRGVPSWQVAPLDREITKRLRGLEAWKALLEMTTPLRDNEARLLSSGLSFFYNAIAERAEEAFAAQGDLDAALDADTLSTKGWRDKSNELWDSYAWKQGLEDGVGIQTPLFRTPEAKRLWLEGRGVEPPQQLAFDRIVELYYSIQPQADPLTGEEDISSFMRMRQEVIDVLPDDLKVKLKNYLERKTTPLRKRYEEGNRTFMRPYWDWQSYAPQWWEDRGDRKTADFFRGIISRAEQAAKAKNDAIRQAKSPREREAVVRKYSNNYDMRVYRKIREQYRARLMREDPRIFDFKMKFLEDVAI